MKTSLLLLTLLALTGCAVSRQRLIDTTSVGGTNFVRETRSKIFVVGSARQTIESIRASNGRTQQLGITDAEQTSTSTNMANNILALVKLLETMQGK